MDIRTHFALAVPCGDYLLSATGLEAEPGLESAVLISLFSNARVGDAGGWWADTFAADPLDRVGASRLWTLAREKLLPATLRLAETYAVEALQWLVADGIALRVMAAASIPRPGVLGLSIQFVRPAGPIRYDLQILWSAYAL